MKTVMHGLREVVDEVVVDVCGNTGRLKGPVQKHGSSSPHREHEGTAACDGHRRERVNLVLIDSAAGKIRKN